MVQYLIVWTETAIKQRRGILRYWTLRNQSTVYSEKLIEQIRERIELISKNPEMGKESSHLNTRQVAMGNFSIYYKALENQLIITAFWDNRQDPKKIFKLLNKK